MNAVVIDISMVLGRVNRPLVDTWLLSGSAAAFTILGVPAEFGGITLTGCALQLTNADGTTQTVTCTKKTRGGETVWCVTFPASHFTHYGIVEGGVRVHGLGLDATETAVDLTLATGNLCIKKDDPTAEPGDLSRGVAYRGEDVFNKAGAPDAHGVQHYKKQTLEWSPEMGDWGVVWTGDYILENGQFVEVDE